jgi:hypothetical protein
MAKCVAKQFSRGVRQTLVIAIAELLSSLQCNRALMRLNSSFELSCAAHLAVKGSECCEAYRLIIVDIRV